MYFAIAAIVVLVVVVCLIAFRPRPGNRLADEILHARFNDSTLHETISGWLNARPERDQQCALFIEAAIAMGCTRSMLNERLLGCVVHSIGQNQDGFGQLLAQALEQLPPFDAPKTAEEEQRQRLKKEDLVDIKSRLRSLDRDGGQRATRV